MSAMSFDEQVVIDAEPGDVWLAVEDPGLVAEWNEKMVGFRPLGDGARGVGYRAELEYVMSGKLRGCTGEIEVYEVGECLRWRYEDFRVEDKFDHGVCYEEFLLKRLRGGRTRLVHKMTVAGLDVPWYVRWLIWFFQRFGTPRGDSTMMRLKRLVEVGSV